MTIHALTAAEIRRLHFAEKWPVNTWQVNLACIPMLFVAFWVRPHHRRRKTTRCRADGPYVSFVSDTLARYPRLRSTRLFDMLCERGYRGSPRTVRRYVQEVRPAPRGETYLRLQPLIGEQAQVIGCTWVNCLCLGGIVMYGLL